MSKVPYSYDYSPVISRKPFKLPKGARVVVFPTVNIEYWEAMPRPGKLAYPGGPNILPLPLPQGVPDLINHTWREYGHRVGIWRIMKVLDKYGVRAAATLNTGLGKKYPIIVEEGRKRGWEFTAHSSIENDLLVNFANKPKEEEKYIRRTLKEYKEVVGKKARGWLSPSISPTINTLDILTREGVDYFCDFANDDEPYTINVGSKTIVSIPYTPELNDYPLFLRQYHTRDEVFGIFKEAFDTLYEEGKESGKIMNIGLHPHVIGQPHRIGTLDKTLAYMKKFKGVMFGTRTEICDWYQSTVLRKGQR